MTFLQHFLPGQAIEENGHDSIGLQTLWANESSDLRVGIEMEYTRGFLKETQPSPTEVAPSLPPPSRKENIMTTKLKRI